jgi:hypothetical protein
MYRRVEGQTEGRTGIRRVTRCSMLKNRPKFCPTHILSNLAHNSLCEKELKNYGHLRKHIYPKQNGTNYTITQLAKICPVWSPWAGNIPLPYTGERYFFCLESSPFLSAHLIALLKAELIDIVSIALMSTYLPRF